MPSWLRRPQPDYPSRAQAAGISGYATVNCAAGRNGRFTDCRITAESPPDVGFGSALRASMRRASLVPGTTGGMTEDARMIVTIRFGPQ
ncbi:energy transducer TonB [Brevundimonas sp.]|uniref:energy transducer TonB n=1 Tax=Brevundimonas sp. TaxID=1871086 RepID=UPI003A0FD1DD